MAKSGKRRIASKEHNVHVAQGIESHRPTSMTPDSLLTAIGNDQQLAFEQEAKRVEDQLIRALGQPYFSESGFFLYNGDCLELLKKMASSDLEIDLTVTSPPYNIGKEYETNLSVEEYISWCRDWIELVRKSTSPSGSFWLNVGYFEVPGRGLCVPIPYLLWDQTDFYLLQEVVWKYGAGVSTNKRLSPRNEKWLYYVMDPSNYTFNLDEIRDPNVKYPNQKKNGKFRCNPLGKNPSDVWDFPKVTTGAKRSSKERTGHPAQFPLSVVDRVVKASSNQNEIVVDPFGGSCSAGIAAVGLGRVFIGMEIREDYCEISAKRFQSFMQEKQSRNNQALLF